MTVPKRELELAIRMTPMPAIWADLSVGLQSGRDRIVRGEVSASEARFTLVVQVNTDKQGRPDFAGPFVHGRVGDRFVYISWGVGDPAASSHEMFRRLKLYLTPVSRRDWSSPGISWEQVAAARVSAEIDGCCPDGSPNCGSAQLRWESA